ncbi:hypothetical protein CMUS01_11585 [Colletotrichum musicola]|uniref:Uncharacterized protein n=1 Tax=Colletotrichum musicola TaxID=2175873 RepID=A0A8H6N5E2_9PEZI|nr:hypothetical protein CMUS01_11585 [Colletotrichum musicola]
MEPQGLALLSTIAKGVLPKTTAG